MCRRAGFTLPEVMLSLFILSSSMFVLSELQVRSMMRVWYGRQDIDRLYLIKKYLYRLSLQPEKARKQSHQFIDPEMKLIVEPRPIHKKSSLAPFAKELQLLVSEGIWDRGGKERSIGIMTLAPRVQEEQGP